MTRTNSSLVNATVRYPAGAQVVIVHGGVDMEPIDSTYTVLDLAANEGWSALSAGARGVEAGVRAVGVLEDHPAFNAGYGAVLTGHGTVETDGAVADGSTRRSAGVGAVPGLRNPAALALQLLEHSDAALLVGDSALQFAIEHGFTAEDLTTAEQRDALNEVLTNAGASVFTGRRVATETVGCIIVEGGRISVAASTGGLVGKLPGRVGDASIPGAGFWADERVGVLCSGSGEASIRSLMSFVVAGRVREFGLQEALSRTVREVMESSAEAIAAVVAVDVQTSEIATAHCGSSFPVSVLDASTATHLGIVL